jgi:hypothetical protein
MRWISLFALMMALSSCYKMPSDDYYSTIPLTNNPQVIPQKGGPSMMPGMSY